MKLIRMDNNQIKALVEFLQRTNLQGVEVPVYVQVSNAIINAQDEVVEEVKKEKLKKRS